VNVDQSTHYRNVAALALFGLVIAVAQVTLLRETLEASGGDELSLALGLTVWLLGSALGAALGALAPARAVRILLSAAGLLLMAAPFAALMLARESLHIFHVSPGELLTLPQQLGSLLFILLPVCLLGGAVFTLACRLPDIMPRTVYSAEAMGWLIGGMAATWLFVITQPFAIFNITAYFSLAAVLLLWPTRWLPAAVALFGLCFGFTVPVSTSPLDTRTENWRWPAQHVIAGSYTLHGHGVVLERSGQRALYVNGHLAMVLPEQQTSEELAHLALLQVKVPAQVLLVGGLGGLLPEVMKHPVHEVTLAEEDEDLTKLAYDYTDDATRDLADDTYIRAYYGDPRRLVCSGGQAWDAILLNLPKPDTAEANRFYTVEFFRAARRALHRGGVLAFALPGSESAYSDEVQQRNGSVYRALAAAFPHVAVTPLGTNYFLASDAPLTLDPAELGRRLKEREIEAQFVNEYYFYALTPPKDAAERAESYRQGRGVNSDSAPIAYLYGVLTHQRIQSGRLANCLIALASWRPWQAGGLLLGLLLVGMLAPAAVWRRGWTGRWSMLLAVAILGFAGMALTILLLLLAQQSLGALYHLLGALTALGMAGIALGAWGSARLGRWGMRGLILLELLLAAILPGLAWALPAWPSALAMLMLGLGMALAGAAVGAIFQLAVSTGLSPGIVYGIDLLGAALAGLSAGTLLLPVHGLAATSFFLAILLAIAIVSLFGINPSTTEPGA